MIPKGIEASAVREISPDDIRRNPENPRLFFRSEEMDTLLASIRRYGIQVPITVFKDRSHFTLIDGERRWRCARKLNLPRIPALVQPKPSPLTNLLLMFNIHALREQWDYLTIANKLPDVVRLYKAENGVSPNEIQLSEITGLTRGQIRRCRYLLDMPSRYRSMLSKELELPKQRQQISEDLFIEMERALKTVSKRIPDAVSDMNTARDALIAKFRGKVITNVTDFRMLSKIATSISNLGVKEARARQTVAQILDPDNRVGIQELYAEHFELKYDEKKVIRNIESIADYLEAYTDTDEIVGQDVRSLLVKLQKLIAKVLES
jgi:ParB family chromosome partitioning protein